MTQCCYSIMVTGFALQTVLLACATTVAGVGDWSVAVPGWKALESGEHPRLIFRRGC